MANIDSLETMEIGLATDVGCVRELNEDTVLGQVFVEETQNPWHISALIAAADGMGGHQGGEVASQLAGETIRKIFASDEVAAMAESEVTGQNLLKHLAESVQHVNRVVHQNGAGEGISRSGTTLTLCLIRPHEYCVGHVGDSRAYLIRRDEIEQITADDSWVGELVRQGEMTEEEAQQSELRNRITKAIGLQAEVEPSVYYGHWESGDVLLVCSDGLSEYVRKPELLSLVQKSSSLQQVCDQCITLAKERGGHDNISVVAARSAASANAVTSQARQPETWPPAHGLNEATKLEIQQGVKQAVKERGKRKKTQPIAWDKRKVAIFLLVVVVALALALVIAVKILRGPKKPVTTTTVSSAEKLAAYINDQFSGHTADAGGIERVDQSNQKSETANTKTPTHTERQAPSVREQVSSPHTNDASPRSIHNESFSRKTNPPPPPKPKQLTKPTSKPTPTPTPTTLKGAIASGPTKPANHPVSDPKAPIIAPHEPVATVPEIAKTPVLPQDPEKPLSHAAPIKPKVLSPPPSSTGTTNLSPPDIGGE